MSFDNKTKYKVKFHGNTYEVRFLSDDEIIDKRSLIVRGEVTVDKLRSLGKIEFGKKLFAPPKEYIGKQVGEVSDIVVRVTSLYYPH